MIGLGLAQSGRGSSAGFAGAIEFEGEGLGGGRRGPLPQIGAVAVVAYFLSR
jgi:hypothetical protein